ncbi:MAG TPA: hypothetical protein VN844_24390 [Pyrinomonadaceae bacterium]|nr:hypothetical protein [Pyrinomonadaceae bacterium]
MVGNQAVADHHETIEEALNRLSTLNLAGVRMKLADPNEGKGWDEAKLARTEQEYLKFLALNYAYPGLTIVPDKDVDEFWHQHILDTRAYANDTMSIFGYFLHHFPYLGTRGPADEERLAQCYSDTRDLYEIHFQKQGHGKTLQVSKCGGGSCSSCATRKPCNI